MIVPFKKSKASGKKKKIETAGLWETEGLKLPGVNPH